MGIFTFSTRHSLIGSITVLVALCMLLIGACRKPDLEPAAALTIAEAGAQNDLPTVVTVGVVRIGNMIVVTGRVERHGSSFVDSVGICFGTDTLPTFMAIQTLRLSIPRDTIPWNFRDTINSMNAVTYVRAFATNVHGTAYGEELLVGDVVVTTGVVNNTTDTSATISGSVTGSGVGERGIRYAPISSQTQPTDVEVGSGSGNFNVELTGLDPATNYQFQAYAYDGGTIVLGAPYTFTTNRCPSVLVAVAENEYRVVEINSRCWMAENLKTTTCREVGEVNGIWTNQILYEANEQWSDATYAALCYPSGSNNPDEYGWLYNGYAIIDPRGLCPQGWEVPTSDDWLGLLQFTGGNSVQLRDPTWNDGTDNFEFSALPAGERNEFGEWSGYSEVGTWWSRTPSIESTQNDSLDSFKIDGTSVSRPPRNIKTGLSVRCIKSL